MLPPGTISGFEPNPTVAIAVSGGPDSMALTLLTMQWLSDLGGKVIALTVDHKLRPESTYEANQVGEWMQAFGIEHHILTLSESITTDVQNRARTLRYAALEQWCHQHGVLHLCTAHHAGDVEETIAMRAWRGSGIAGLAGIPFIRCSEHIRIIRPLLAMTKDALLHYLAAHEWPWLNDPSNASDDYERNVVRKNLAEYPLPVGQATQFAATMAVARQALETDAAMLLACSFRVLPDGTALLDISKWRELAAETACPALGNIVCFLSGSESPPRYHELQTLYSSLLSEGFSTSTLGGLLFERSQKKNEGHLVHLWREPSRISAQRWETTTPLIWDNRFLLHAHHQNAAAETWTIKPLGEQGLQMLQRLSAQIPTHLSFEGKVGLLSIWRLDLLVAVPHISYWNHDAAPHLSEQITIRFNPARQLASSSPRYF